MFTKRFAIVVMVALCCWGCRQGGNDQRVGELLTRQEEHAQHIAQISRKIDAVDEKLAAIEKSLAPLLAGGGVVRPGEKKEITVASNFASTEEYQNIMQQIAILHQQAGVVQQEFAAFRQRQDEGREREALRDPGSAWRAMGEPQELSRRLDILVKNASGRIADPASRDKFIAEVEEMKRMYSAARSPEEKLQEARALLSRAIESAPDDRSRGWMERQLRSLDETSSEGEQWERVDRVLQSQRMREISELARRYNIPGDVMRDSGLVSFERGGPPGFGPGGPRGFEPRGE